ncbi:MAG: hypothetical protein QW734_04075 [Candidatus Bathyarchaeia archaeon]
MKPLEIAIDKKKIIVQDSILKIVEDSAVEEYDLSKLSNVGVKRKFSRPLLMLTLVFAVIGIINAENPAYIILAAIMFLSVIILREEAIVLVFKDKTVVLDSLDRGKSKGLLKIFEKHLERKR